MRIKLLLISCFSICFLANADQNIEVIGGNAAGLPKIAIIDFANDDNKSTDIIANDLSITGEFNVKNHQTIDNIDKSVQYVITGAIDKTIIQYKLVSRVGSSETTILNQKISINKQDPRKIPHAISNVIYKQITNTMGVFGSKIAYVTKNGTQYSLIVADYDGYNQVTLLSTKSPIISLSWNTDGQQISYATYESNKPVVYVQYVYKPVRYVVANFNGSNSSPSFTPDGKNLTVTLSKEYGSHVFIVKNQNFSNKTTATSLINFGTIDTEASIGKNGSIVFTSNHDGGPQIFMTDLSGTAPIRLTAKSGEYNTSAKLSHDLSKMVFISRSYGVLKAHVMDLTTKVAYPVSLNLNLDMAPSFAPNDKLILFSSNHNLYIVNTTGTTQTKLNNINGEIIDQVWANNF